MLKRIIFYFLLFVKKKSGRVPNFPTQTQPKREIHLTLTQPRDSSRHESTLNHYPLWSVSPTKYARQDSNL